MKVVFVVQVHDPVEDRDVILTYKANIPWPAVPRTGERVSMPTADGLPFRLGSLRVADICYLTDGKIQLEMHVDVEKIAENGQTTTELITTLLKAGWRDHPPPTPYNLDLDQP